MRLLSVDGGGIRGLVPALVLAEIERRTHKRISELFDLVAGTSTGGIIALGLACPGSDGAPRYTANDVADLYRKHGRDIFPHEFLGRLRQLFAPKYAARGIERILRDHFEPARLSDALVEVFVPAYEIETRDPFFFRSARARSDPGHDYPMWQVARATSAAPTYFPPFRATSLAGSSWALVDGGLFANNPGIWAAIDLLARGRDLDDLFVVSLGTAGDSSKRTIPLDEARGWGLINWVRPIIDIALSAGSDATEFGLTQLLGSRSYRFTPDRPQPHSEALDDADPANIDLLEKQAELLIERRSADLDAVCQRLIRAAG